jgi:hypothetical protein
LNIYFGTVKSSFIFCFYKWDIVFGHDFPDLIFSFDP